VKPKKSGTKKAYNFQLKILQAPGIRQEAKREQREEEHQSRGGNKARELGCQGREGRSDGEKTEGGPEERERERERKRTNYSRQKGPPFSGPIIGCHFP